MGGIVGGAIAEEEEARGPCLGRVVVGCGVEFKVVEGAEAGEEDGEAPPGGVVG